MSTATSTGLATGDLGPRVAAQRHPIYDLFREEWTKLMHVREGTGGFMDGTYLIAHPREWMDHTSVQTVTDAVTGVRSQVVTTNPTPRKPTAKLKARRAIARYENLAGSILEAKKSALFREQPTRRVGEDPDPKAEPTDLENWWEDVDGKGTHIDDAMPAWWDLAATFGHVLLYMELPTVPAPAKDTTYTAADRGMPKVCVYTPLDVIHWLTNEDGKIISIKVVEAVPLESFQSIAGATQYRVRVIDETGWALYDFKSGKALEQGVHGFGTLPVVWLFGKRRPILSDVGQSIFGDPKLYQDLYNLTSELRELLRNQTFSFINLPLGTGADAMSVEQAQAMLGQQTGTMNVLFSGGTASVLTADAANVVTYHDDIQALRRSIYRECGVQWESDSKDAEATGSLELKREEMNTRLAAYADECQQAEYGLVDLWYRAQYGEESGPQKLDTDMVTIQYPDRFSATPFDDLLGQLQAAQTGGFPPIFLKALRKALVTKFEGIANLPQPQLDAILKAIDAATDDLTPQDQAKQRLEATMTAVKGGKPVPKAAQEPPSKAA